MSAARCISMGAYHTVTQFAAFTWDGIFGGMTMTKGHAAGVDGRSYWRFLCLLFVADTHIWQSWSIVARLWPTALSVRGISRTAACIGLKASSECKEII